MAKLPMTKEGLMWSDRFFNWDDIGQAWDGNGWGNLHAVAKRFCELNPECPFTPTALVNDFLGRV